MVNESRSRFDDQYKNACLRDDIAVAVWQDSWASCLDHCASELIKKAHTLLETPGYEIAAHHLLATAEKFRREDEDNKQAWTTGDNRKRSSPSDIF